MLRGIKALHSLLSQISFTFLMFLIGGTIVFGIALIVYLVLVGRWEDTRAGERRAAVYRRVLATAFCAFWVVALLLMLVVDKVGESGKFVVYLIPFDPASIFIGDYSSDYILDDLGNWMTAPWIHQRRIIVSLLNLLLFLPLGAALPVAIGGRHRYAAACALLLVVAAGIEVAQFVMMSGAVYTDNVLMRFVGGLLGMLAYRLAAGCQNTRKEKPHG